MIISEFLNKWKNIPFENGIMQMISPNSKLWLSRDHSNRKSLVFFCNFEPNYKFKSGSFDIIKSYNGNQWIISIVLTNDQEEDVFEFLLWDLFEATLGIFDEEHVFQTIYKRLINWSKLFENKENLLSREKIIGLIGELFFISNILYERFNLKEIIDSWRGPLGEDQDFTFSSEWDEIKTVKYGSDRIKISSIEQLDRSDLGFLNVIEIEDSNSQNQASISLTSLIKDIRNRLNEDIDTLLEFNRRLIQVGYKDDERYDQIRFLIKRIRNFNVTETFPKITRVETRQEIVNLNYTLSISSLTSWNGDLYYEY